MSGKFKILIGYDGSEYAEAAIDDLANAGLPDEAAVFVMTVTEMWLQTPPTYAGVENSYDAITVKAESLGIALNVKERLEKKFPAWTIGCGAALGSPSAILLEKAEEWKPDLIVVGSQSRGRIGRFFFGSVAQSLVHNALCSVRVVRKRDEDNHKESEKPARLIVGVDESAGAQTAIDSIISRHWREGSRVRVVSAMNCLIGVNIKSFDLVEPADGRLAEFYHKEKARIDEIVDRAVARLERAGLSASAVIKNEDPKDLLIAEAGEWKADCIFVGAKGTGWLERALLGSVSSAVAARAPCSVEVARVSP